MPVLKSTLNFDIMATIAAGLLQQIHTPQNVMTRRYHVLHEDHSYRSESNRNPFADFSTCIGYAISDCTAALSEHNKIIPLNARTGGVEEGSWVNFDFNANPQFHPFTLNHTVPHYDVTYNPEDIQVVVVFSTGSSNEPKAGFQVTELRPGEDYTRDWVIKQRAPHISEIEAFKLVKFTGRCSIVEAAQWIHLLNQARGEIDAD